MKALVTEPIPNLLSESTILFVEKSSIPKPRDQDSLPEMEFYILENTFDTFKMHYVSCKS